MYILTVKDSEFNTLVFRFDSMKELGAFASTVLANSVREVEITVKKGGE